MKLICSREHLFNTNKDIWNKELKSGDRCPMVISYDRMSGVKRCKRILRELKKERFALGKEE